MADPKRDVPASIMVTLFISDLHLHATRPLITRLFLDFLSTRARSVDALYILGDLFEYWVGDDAMSLTEFSNIVQGLGSLTSTGVPVYVMHGNRDFLIGQRFATETGCHLLLEPTCINLYGTDVLILHGDSLCTDDPEHQAWRKKVLTADWQRHFLAKSLSERTAIALELRQQSDASKKGKSMALMDINQDAVARIMSEYGVTRLIHGHTHHPGKHQFSVDGKPAFRYVLGDWYRKGSALVCSQDKWELENLSPIP